MLDVRRMRVLREVALRGTIRAAAEALSFTPSAVSQQISTLERETGVALLERTGRSVRLTDAGRALVARTDAILAQLAAAEEEMRAAGATSGGTLRLAAFPSAAATIVADAVRRFARRYPSVETTLVEADPKLGLASVRSGEATIALVWEYDFVPLEPDGSLALAHLLDDPVHVVLARGHPAAARKSIALAELANDSWINSTRASSCHRFVPRACNAAGFEPRIAAETNDHHALQRLVASGVGLALVPALSLVDARADLAVRAIAPGGPRRRIYAAYRREREGEPRLQAMLALLWSAAEEWQRVLQRRSTGAGGQRSEAGPPPAAVVPIARRRGGARRRRN